MKEDQEILLKIGMLLERYSKIEVKDPEVLTDYEVLIFNTFGFYVYRGQPIEDVLTNIKNQI